MTDQKSKPLQDQKTDDAQFRAVVKRLLDTPPLHKAVAQVKKPKPKQPK